MTIFTILKFVHYSERVWARKVHVDVAHPIRAAIPSLDGVVLEVLDSSTLPLPLSRVHRLAGVGSVAGIRRVLLRLCASGLAQQVPGGFLLNREHLAAPAIHLLTDMRAELSRRIRRTVSEWPQQPVLVATFGSFARRDGNERSDIDLLVIGPRSLASSTIDLAEAVQRWTGNNCQVVHRSTQDVHRLNISNEPLLRHWQDDAVVIVGDRSILGSGNAKSHTKRGVRKA